MKSSRFFASFVALIALNAVSGSSFAAEAVAGETTPAPEVSTTAQAPAAEPTTAEGVNPVARPGRTGFGLNVGTSYLGLTAKTYLADYFATQVFLGTTIFGGFSVGLDGVFEGHFSPKGGRSVLKTMLGAGVNRSSLEVAGVPLKTTHISAVLGLGIQFKRVPIETMFEYRVGGMSVTMEPSGSEYSFIRDLGFTTRYFF